MSDRDKFLTEAMGGCDHDWFKPVGFISGHECCKCHKYWPVKPMFPLGVVDFSTWEGFGKLWEWAVDQEWWGRDRDGFTWWLHDEGHNFGNFINIINPDRFATAIYDYLNPKETP